MPDKLKILLSHSSSRYFIVGLSAFALDYLTLLLTFYVLNFDLKLATALGFTLGFIASFAANRQWVFANSKHKKKIHRQISEYISLLMFNFFFTVWAVNFLNNQGISPIAGKLIVMALIMCWNYTLFRWVIFASSSE